MTRPSARLLLIGLALLLAAATAIGEGNAERLTAALLGPALMVDDLRSPAAVALNTSGGMAKPGRAK